MKLNKLMSAVAISVAAFAGSTQAMTLPDFQVTPGAANQGTVASFTADKITGNYTEVISFDGAGGFNVSIQWKAGQFVANDGTTALDSDVTGLGIGYGIYALFIGHGTVSASPSGVVFSLTGGNTEFWLDDKAGTTTFTAPAVGGGAFTLGSNGDDKLLGSSNAATGDGNLTTVGACGGSNVANCGSFGQSTGLNLTVDGLNFFTAPVPFYSATFAAGQLNSFSPTGTQSINGSLDVSFNVPEPGSLALAGLALIGLGMARRRKA